MTHSLDRSIGFTHDGVKIAGAGLGAKGDKRRNFEMGLWTESAGLIDSVMEQFNQLWEGHHCPGCGRKDICPVPLEEPAL